VLSLKLYYSATTEPFSDSANDGFGMALKLLRQIRDSGVQCDVIDTTAMSDENKYRAYATAWPLSVSKKLGIRRVFGTRRRSGCFFGKEVPALLVYEEGSENPVDVYPRDELGRTVTIREFLEQLTSSKS
jgi:hypothetical protein